MFDRAFALSNTKTSAAAKKRIGSTNRNIIHQTSSTKRRTGGGGGGGRGHRRRRRRQYGTVDEHLPIPPSPPTLTNLLEQRQLSGFSTKFHRRVSQIKQISQPFSKLNTSPSEAVLGINGDGTQFYSLATNGLDGLKLIIRGLSLNRPPPHQHQQRQRQRQRHTARNQQHPILNEITLETQSPLNDASPVATIPVDILMTSDWNLGIARIASLQQRDLGTLILIQPESPNGVFATARNMRVGGVDGAMTLRNHLWKCSRSVPVEGGSKRRLGPGYLFLNDEDDGYRLIWLQPPNSHAVLEHVAREAIEESSQRSDILSYPQDESVWDGDTSWISSESYLQVDALLDDIRSQRKQVFAYNELKSPDFFYNIVDFDGHSVLTLLLVFGNRSGKAKELTCIGVFVKINLLSGTYKEVEWIQNQQTPEPRQLQMWCYQLAIYRRMQSLRIVPRTRADNLHSIVLRLSETNHVGGAATKQHTDTNIGSGNAVTQSQTSYAALYPDCDVLSNLPVRSGLAVKVLTCRSGTTQFTYS